MPAWPKPSELAILTVNGRDYQEWESVSVRTDVHNQPPALCRFTCSEGHPIVSNLAKMQIIPGMECEVSLAGQKAFKGKVETRQVYYDSKRHHIEIICVSLMDVITTSVISPTGKSKLKTFKDIAEPKLRALGYKLVFEGGPAPTYKFPRVSETHGELLLDHLDVLARMLGLHFATNANEDFVAIVGPNGASDSVTEGKDILIGREILNRPSARSYNPVMTQGTGSDKKYGPQISHMPFYLDETAVKQFMATFTTVPAVVRNELASSDKEMLKQRAIMEQSLQEGDRITVFATVQGWLRPSGGLWERNQEVIVTSPMLVMNGELLRTKTVVFTQDDATGTRTTLELCNPAAMGTIQPEIK